jgi:hypothetical protein
LREFFQSLRERNDRGAIGLLLLLVTARLALAVLVYARPNLALQNDSDRYVPIANAILSGQAYAWNTDRPGELLNTIGYPAFLAGAFLIFGQGAGNVAIAQLILSGLIALIFYFSLARIMGTTPALISGALLAVDPLTILWAMTILTEVVFAGVLAIGGLMLIRWASSGRTSTLVIAGFFCALACLVKPYAELIVAAWAVALLFFPRSAIPGGVGAMAFRLRRALLFIVPVLIMVAPWIVRNGLLWNCPTLSSVDRVTMRDYVAAKVVSETEGIPLAQAQARLQTTDPGVCPRDNAAYVSIVLSHLKVYAQLHVAGTLPVLLGTSFDRWLQFFGINYALPDLFQPFMERGLGGVARVLYQEFLRFPAGLGLMFALAAFQLLIYLLALLGVLALRDAPSATTRWIIIIAATAVLILVLTPGQGGHERFRVPAQPFLMILAGYGIASRTLPLVLKHRSHRSVPSSP